MVKRYLVAVTGPNRPGILAAVGNAIAELGGDIHEVRQVSLQGFFSMLLAVDFPLHRDPGVISGHLGDVCKAFSADISIKDPEIELWDEEPAEGARHFLTLSGHNTPGVASLISARLARDGIDPVNYFGGSVPDDRTYLPLPGIPGMVANPADTSTDYGAPGRPQFGAVPFRPTSYVSPLNSVAVSTSGGVSVDSPIPPTAHTILRPHVGAIANSAVAELVDRKDGLDALQLFEPQDQDEMNLLREPMRLESFEVSRRRSGSQGWAVLVTTWEMKFTAPIDPAGTI